MRHAEPAGKCGVFICLTRSGERKGATRVNVFWLPTEEPLQCGSTPVASPFKQRADIPRCAACDNDMDLTVIIPPVGSPYGLKVYTCPRCGRSEDYLFHP